MVEYICEDCGKEFKHKGVYHRHKNRKTPCKKIKPEVKKISNMNEPLYKCEYCFQSFTYKNNYYRHKKLYCTHKNNIMKKSEESYDKILEKLNNIENNLENNSDESDDEFTENNDHNIKKMLNKLNKIYNKNTINITKNTVTNNIINNNQTNNILNINQICLLPYGKENLDYISKKEKMDLLRSPHTAIPKFIKAVHFNEDHPENQNVFVFSIKDKLIKFYREDGRWEYHDLQEAIEKFTIEKYDQINDLYSGIEKSIEYHIKEKFEDFAKDFDLEKGNIRKNAEYKTKLALLSGSEWIKKINPSKKQLDIENKKLKLENEKLKLLLKDK